MPDAMLRRLLPAGRAPYAYQVEVGARVLAGENLVLRAPTGCGKTLAALAPFLAGYPEGRWSRLLYAQPLRTLVRSVHEEARRAVKAAGLDLDVRMQTGEDPDDPLFALGDIVVCTYDQLLSGLLAGPYGLPKKLANINCAAIAGALVVFDEFHLMAPERAFLTATAGLRQFGGLTQSLWMSATATKPLLEVLAGALSAACVDLPENDWAAVPAVSSVERTFEWVDRPLTPEDVLAERGKRVVAIVNQVDWAQELYDAIPASPDWPKALLHSRFFRPHRNAKEAAARDFFGPRSDAPGVLICTQVIEAGVDITSDVLLTQLAPMNALVQRAGRCARFPPRCGLGVTQGAVRVFALPEGEHLPYGQADLARSAAILTREARRPTRVDPKRSAAWVEEAHTDLDAAALRSGWKKRGNELLDLIRANALGGNRAGVADFIREADDDVRVIIDHQPPERVSEREVLSASQGRLYRLLKEAPDAGWVWTGGDPGEAWDDLRPAHIARAHYVCLRPEFARYDADLGLRLGEAGDQVSPRRAPPPRPGHKPLQKETWMEHTEAVLRQAEQRAVRELPPRSPAAARLPLGLSYEHYLAAVRFCALMHDFGKLQHGWQEWAAAYQASVDATFTPGEPLAHTTSDASNAEHKAAEAAVKAMHSRPPHAAQSAYFASAVWTLATELPAERRAGLHNACLAAITAHHGGWGGSCTVFQALHRNWRTGAEWLAQRFGLDTQSLEQAEAWSPKPPALATVLQAAAEKDLREWWPITALLTRVLRLSDQKATEEGTDG